MTVNDNEIFPLGFNPGMQIRIERLDEPPDVLPGPVFFRYPEMQRTGGTGR